MAVVESVNVGVVRPLTPKVGSSAIDKRPADGPVLVRAPGPKKGVSGLVTDQIASAVHHGGNDQAVYAYAREDLDAWQAELDRPLAAGAFGENLTTVGVDVTGALVGEHWEIGAELVLQVSVPRIPCSTFAARMAVPRWVRTFTDRAAPGTYLRVLRPGPVAAGDPVVVTNRPDHDITIGLMFRALTTEPDLLPRLAIVPDLHPEVRAKVRRRLASAR
ncbi:MAG TPA: MOSC domain-containing protein [Nakamurella sp.]